MLSISMFVKKLEEFVKKQYASSLPPHISSFTNSSFFAKLVLLWNAVPTEIRLSTNRLTFNVMNWQKSHTDSTRLSSYALYYMYVYLYLCIVYVLFMCSMYRLTGKECPTLLSQPLCKIYIKLK